ncbi:MAG: Crp/Fnr family transcriptional regulator [Campylobacterales bacterium]|nr:Crp/Fnr family transcriptional regulator [Campylobacterales bacterium]
MKSTELTPAALERLAPALPQKRRLVFEAGATPFDGTDTQKHFYFIMDGVIKISQINPKNGREQTLYLLSRGDMFDVISLLDGAEHEYVAQVLERAELVEVEMAQVRTLLEHDVEFKRFFFPYMAAQLRQMEQLASDLSLRDVYDRLLNLFGRYARSDGSLRLIGNLSHEELAALVGSVRKVVNRALQQLKEEGVIELSRKHLRLKSLKKLLDRL